MNNKNVQEVMDWLSQGVEWEVLTERYTMQEIREGIRRRGGAVLKTAPIPSGLEDPHQLQLLPNGVVPKEQALTKIRAIVERLGL